MLSRHAATPQAGVEFVTADLTTGGASTAAVAGVEIIVHLAGTPGATR